MVKMNKLLTGSNLPLISAIVTVHAEGLVAHHTLLGLERLRSYAANHGITVESCRHP
jgi:hypothetical protein